VGGKPASYCGGPGLKSLFGDNNYRMGKTAGFLSLFRYIPDQKLKLGHDHFLPLVSVELLNSSSSKPRRTGNAHTGQLKDLPHNGQTTV
jgi:hypothetical protein